MDEALPDIVKKCQKGDSSAQKRLYDLYAPKMYSLCLRYVKDRNEAQEVLMDGFLKVFKGIAKLESIEYFDTWIFSIMVNTSLNQMRKRHMLPTDFEQEENQVGIAALDLDQFDIEPILAALDQLPDAQRIIFNLSEVEGYPNNEIAEMLGIQISSVRSNLSRAKENLRKLLYEEYAQLATEYSKTHNRN